MSSISAITSATPAQQLVPPGAAGPADDPLQKTFQQAIAGLLFGELVKSLRSTVGEPAYLHGGQAERMFQSQMDQYLVEDLAEQSGAGLVGDLYRQFRVQLGLPVETVPPADVSGLSSLSNRPPRRETPDIEALPAISEPALPDVSESREPLESAKPAGSLSAAELLELARQARSVVDSTLVTTPTSVLSGLFRK